MDVQVNEFIYEFPDDLSATLIEILNAIAPLDRKCRYLPLGGWLVRLGETAPLIHMRLRFDEVMPVRPDTLYVPSERRPACEDWLNASGYGCGAIWLDPYVMNFTDGTTQRCFDGAYGRIVAGRSPPWPYASWPGTSASGSRA